MIQEALTDAQVLATFPVMSQLRPHLREDEYLETVRRMRPSGYRLAFSEEDGEARCIAGFRIFEFLAHGRFLYVDDFVTAEDARSGGYGGRMIEWLENEARENGCAKLQLDSGVGRHDAHRFYFREGMMISSYHFSKEL